MFVPLLNVSLLKKEDFFRNTAYFDSTQLSIDSIVYAPGFNKLAVFVMTKNPVQRQIVTHNNYKWYYDATCYLGVRQNDPIRLSWIGPGFTTREKQVGLFISTALWWVDYIPFNSIYHVINGLWKVE